MKQIYINSRTASNISYLEWYIIVEHLATESNILVYNKGSSVGERSPRGLAKSIKGLYPGVRLMLSGLSTSNITILAGHDDGLFRLFSCVVATSGWFLFEHLSSKELNWFFVVLLQQCDGKWSTWLSHLGFVWFCVGSNSGFWLKVTLFDVVFLFADVLMSLILREGFGEVSGKSLSSCFWSICLSVSVANARFDIPPSCLESTELLVTSLFGSFFLDLNGDSSTWHFWYGDILEDVIDRSAVYLRTCCRYSLKFADNIELFIQLTHQIDLLILNHLIPIESVSRLVVYIGDYPMINGHKINILPS